MKKREYQKIVDSLQRRVERAEEYAQRLAQGLSELRAQRQFDVDNSERERWRARVRLLADENSRTRRLMIAGQSLDEDILPRAILDLTTKTGS